MKKRLFTRGIALGLAAVMLAGCSGSGTSTSQGSTDAGTTGQSAETQASQGQEQTTIEMWYHISPDQATLLLQMIDEFQELHPGPEKASLPQDLTEWFCLLRSYPPLLSFHCRESQNQCGIKSARRPLIRSRLKSGIT